MTFSGRQMPPLPPRCPPCPRMGTAFKVRGKVNNIALDSCSKTGVVFSDVIASCEVSTCKGPASQYRPGPAPHHTAISHIISIILASSTTASTHLPPVWLGHQLQERAASDDGHRADGSSGEDRWVPGLSDPEGEIYIYQAPPGGCSNS